LITLSAGAQSNVVIPSGSYIINMGVVPQTVNNGLKPYGLIYQLLNIKCPVRWVINTSKVKDGAYYTYNGVEYKGGTFIIDAQYRTSDVNNLITTWTNPLGIYKVVGVTTTSPVTVPAYRTIWYVPRWTMDKQNGSIAVNFFNNAGIPSTAYGGASSTDWETPAQLDCCDDIFVMPHADPIWSTHGHLYEWVNSTGNGINSGCKSGVWLGCHAGSALMDMFDNVTPDYNMQTNFLVDKTGPAVGTGPWSENALLLWGNHTDGTLPYSYDFPTDPIMQFMGTIEAATQQGSEQIFITKGGQAGWFPTTHVGVYDPDHTQRYDFSDDIKYRAAILAYGPAMGIPGNGKVMLQAGHNISRTTPDGVAAQRAFFNYSLLVAWERAVLPGFSGLPDIVYSGNEYPLSYTTIPNIEPASVQIYTAVWSSSCGGTFSPSNTSSTPTFIPPIANTPIQCNITVKITDGCGRISFDTHAVNVMCDLIVTPTITNPCFNTPGGGSINMAITNDSGPYAWSWTKSGGGSGSGTGTTITGLSAGDYVVTVTANSGAGCSASFSVTLSSSPQINITATSESVSCNGGSNGAINVSVSGGIPGYSYLWSDGSTTQNRSGLTAGTYSLTVTDSKGCQATVPVIVTQPSAVTITSAVTNVSCYGENNGTINLTVSGGTSPFTYLWNDGNSSQNRTGLAPGTYSVTVTDANNCTQASNNITITQPTAALSLSGIHTDLLCYGVSTGSINLSVIGGTSPYTFAWTGPGTYSATTEDISNRPAGIYNVTVTDNKGCTASISVTLIQPVALSLSTLVKQPTCPPTPPATPASPAVNSDGTITLSVSGGTPGYSFLWTTLDGSGLVPADQNQSGLTAGTYNVTVTDNNGCTATTSLTMNYINPNPVQPSSIKH